MEITAAATALGKSPSTEPQPPAAGRARRDADPGGAGGGVYRNGGPERRVGRRDRDVDIEIVIATPAEAWMRLQRDAQEQIAGRTAPPALGSLSGQADQLPVTNAGGKVDGDLTAVQRQPPPSARQRVLEREFQERLAIAAAHRPVGTAGARPEQGLEQVLAELHAA